MKIAILDKNTVTIGDIDFSSLDALGDVKYYDTVEHSLVAECIGDADAVICNKAKITAEIMDKCENLKYIGLFATGYNNIDTEYAAKKGIVVCNAPGYSRDSVVQHVFALLFQIAGSINKYNDFVADGNWTLSPLFSCFPFPIIELANKTIGIIGYGDIGKKIAQVAKSFGMNVVVSTRTKPDNCEFEVLSKEELFSISDVISINCPLNKETEKMINKETLALMKNNAILINTSRGGVIDETALCDALNNGTIFAAGLDVLTDEPMSKDCPLINAKNCIITPHTAWASLEARKRLVELVADNLRAYIKGNIINKVN